MTYIYIQYNGSKAENDYTLNTLNSLPGIIVICFFSVGSFFLVIFIQAHSFIISLLAIQRFIIFYYPQFERITKASGKEITIVIYMVYNCFFAINIILLAWYGHQLWYKYYNDWPEILFLVKYMSFFVFILQLSDILRTS